MGSKKDLVLAKAGTPGGDFGAESLSFHPGEGELGSVGEGLVALVLGYDAIL